MPAKNSKNKLNESRWHAFIICNEFKDNTDRFIEKVTFHLHKTFRPPVVIVDEAPFIVSRVGWGYFDIKIEVTFKKWTGIKRKTIDYELQLRDRRDK